jgi:hypothetical protein
MGDLLLSDLKGLRLGPIKLEIFNRALYHKVSQVRTSTDDSFNREIQRVIEDMRVEQPDKQPRYWVKMRTSCQRIRNRIRNANAYPNLPYHIECPICVDILTDAMITRSGQSFCQVCIEAQIELTGIHPITREPLTIQELVPNFGLREAATHYTEYYQMYNIL